MRKKVSLIIALLLTLATSVFAQSSQPIPAEQAFQFSATARDYQTILLMWKIAPGYYLYRDRIQFSSFEPNKIRLGQPLFPTGLDKFNSESGHYTVYANQLQVPIPVIESQKSVVNLRVTYQGCSEAGYCYPPITKVVRINLAGNYMIPVIGFNAEGTLNATTESHSDKVTQLLADKNLWTIILGFFGFGLLVAFTPCVLPMVPILSGIILGHKKMTHWHAFLLSLSYVMGMAITYAAAGMLFGYLGGTAQALLQKPWIIIVFSAIFVALACALFGFYNLQLPESLRSKFAHLSEHQKHGTYAGVFLMGCFSTLILSPCVTPPLVAVLGYIGQSGNASLGGIALFSMGLGMGLPLLIIGASSSRLLPKAGPWMKHIEVFMGIMLLAVAIYMLSRLFAPTLIMLLWSGLFIGYGVYLGALSSVSESLSLIRKCLGLLFFIYGIVLVVGTSTNSANPWNPLQLTQTLLNENLAQFTTIHSSDDLQHELAKPENFNKPVLLDFYADWCVSCKIIESQVFHNPIVQQRLKEFVLLRADVTANNVQNRTLLQQFNVVAPPTIIFLDKNHHEVKDARIVGEMSAKEFLQHLDRMVSDSMLRT